MEIQKRDTGTIGDWRAVHFRCGDAASLATVMAQVPQLACLGVNRIIMEVNHGFAYRSHPELVQGNDPITAAAAGQMAAQCRQHGIELIPQFQCLGHQSWKEHTDPLLTVYPELDIAPGAFPGNEGIYCREWDPLNPAVYEIVLPLLRELIEAFAAKSFHVGMDEVFLLGCEQSPTTRGGDPAQLFAGVVRRLHEFLTGEQQVEMLMWGDRLIDGNRFPYDEWESDYTGTAAALEQLPRDIIICDWHYDLMEAYPSVPLFAEAGFRVLPVSWEKAEATLALIDYSRHHGGDACLGHLFTNWGTSLAELAIFPPLLAGLERLRNE